MTNHQDIIGIAEQVREKVARNPWPFPREEMTYILKMSEADTLAKALLIAVEALEKIASEDQDAYGFTQALQDIANPALSRIRSL
jgi:hypothetical protein